MMHPSHNCTILNRCMLELLRMLKVENLKFEQYKIEFESIFNGNCALELSIAYILTTLVDERSPFKQTNALSLYV